MTSEPDSEHPAPEHPAPDEVPETRRGRTNSEVGPRGPEDVTRSRELADELEHHAEDPDLVDLAGLAAPEDEAHLQVPADQGDHERRDAGDTGR